MPRFTIGFLFLCFCFGTCLSITGAEKLLDTFKEQEEVSQRVTDSMIANWSSIRTWQGKAIVSSETFDRQTNSELPMDIRYEVDFAFDVVSGNKAWKRRHLDVDSSHTMENSFIRDETYHCLTTRFSPTGETGLRQLHISALPSPAVAMQFDPFESSIPSTHSQGTIVFRFSMTILEPRMANRRGNKDISEEQNEKFKQNVLANGFKDYRFRLDGNVLIREYLDSGRLQEVFVINLGKGGSIMAYRRFAETIIPPFESKLAYSWDATYQKINTVWVPQQTKSSQVYDDGSTRVEKIEWLDQTINQKIPEERFTVKGIGAFQGIEVIDYRLGGKAFKATGDEYPPEYEIQKRPKSYFPSILIGIGLVIILFAIARLIYIMLKKTGAKQ